MRFHPKVSDTQRSYQHTLYNSTRLETTQMSIYKGHLHNRVLCSCKKRSGSVYQHDLWDILLSEKKQDAEQCVEYITII